jgi:hypothetical protein
VITSELLDRNIDEALHIGHQGCGVAASFLSKKSAVAL